MRNDKTVYRGRRIGENQDTLSDIEVTRDDETLSPDASLKVRNHSPDGFNWGYGGSGPAQLALAILLDFTGDINAAQARYQDFKRQFVSMWGNDWEINGAEITRFINGGGAISRI